jgi:hypothetical protein
MILERLLQMVDEELLRARNMMVTLWDLKLNQSLNKR